MISAKDKPIIIYDGDCRLCQSAVKFLKTRNGSSGFEFIPSSEPNADQLLNTYQLPKEITEKSVIFIKNSRLYTKSTAVIKALQQRGGIWRIAGILFIFPAFMRNLVYDLIAKNRQML